MKNNNDSWSQNAHCNSTCTGDAPHCGDGVVNGSETCDTRANNYCYVQRPEKCGSGCDAYDCYDIYYLKCDDCNKLEKGTLLEDGEELDEDSRNKYTSTECP